MADNFGDDEFGAASSQPRGSEQPAWHSGRIDGVEAGIDPFDEDDTAEEIGAPVGDFMHDLSIDTLAQLHAHREWTPFVTRRRQRRQARGGHARTPSNVSAGGSTSSRDESACHTPHAATLAFAWDGATDATDASLRTPARVGFPHVTTSHRRTRSTPSPGDSYGGSRSTLHTGAASPSIAEDAVDLDRTSGELRAMHEDDEDDPDRTVFGPFSLPSESECVAFFRDVHRWLEANRDELCADPIQLYNPVTDAILAHVTVPNIGDGATRAIHAVSELQSALPSPLPHISPDHVPAAAFAPMTPLPFGSPLRGFDTRATPSSSSRVALPADASFAFSPAPVALRPLMDTTTPRRGAHLGAFEASTSFLSPIHPPHTAAAHPTSILKTPITLSKAAAASPALVFSPAIRDHAQTASPFAHAMLSPISAGPPRRTPVAADASSFLPAFPTTISGQSAATKMVRFTVPHSHNTTLDSSRGSTGAASFSATSQLHGVSVEAGLESSLPLAAELSLFDATLDEMSMLRARCFGGDADQADAASSSEPSSEPFHLDRDAPIGFTVGLSEAEAEERLHASRLSRTLDASFEPLERLDATHRTRDETDAHVEDESATAPAVAPFKIIVDAPAASLATAHHHGASTNVSGVFAEASFHSSSSSSGSESVALDESHRRTSPAPVASASLTPAFLRVPGRRGRASSSSSPRVSITRVHTSSARVLRVRARFHRKTRDLLTGRKQHHTLRILPAAARTGEDGRDVSRTLDFMAATSGSDTDLDATLRDRPRSQISGGNSKIHAGTRFPHTAVSQHLHHSLQEIGLADSRRRDASSRDSLLPLDRSASRVNLSETFERVSMLADTPEPHRRRSHGSAAAASPTLNSSLPSFAFSPVSGSAPSAGFAREHLAFANDAPSPIVRVSSKPIERTTPTSITATAAAAAAPPSEGMLYAQHVLRGKLQAHRFRTRATPTRVPSYRATPLPAAAPGPTSTPNPFTDAAGAFSHHQTLPTLAHQAHQQQTTQPNENVSFLPFGAVAPPSTHGTSWLPQPQPTYPGVQFAGGAVGVPAAHTYVPVQMFMCIAPVSAPQPTTFMPATIPMSMPMMMPMPVAQLAAQQPSLSWHQTPPPATSHEPTPPRPLWTVHPSSAPPHAFSSPPPPPTVAHAFSSPFAPSPSLAAARHRLCQALAGVRSPNSDPTRPQVHTRRG